MTSNEARRILDLVGGGMLNPAFSSHFLQRLRERLPGMGAVDVLTVLRRGTLRGEPLWDDAHGNHKVRVRGSARGFGEVELVLAISWLDDAVAVTVYSIDRK
jgi:hypothetical protein